MDSHPILPKIPTIDFSNQDLKPGSSSWFSTSNQVRHALEEYGCFVAVYDKVSLELQHKVFSHCKDLFDLPLEVKRKNTYEEPLRGYIGGSLINPLYETFGIDNATDLEATQKFMNLMLPAGIDQICESAHSFAKLVAELDQMVVQMVFQSYGAGKHYDSIAASNSYVLRFIKYREPQNEIEAGTGLFCHTDKNFTSIILQKDVSGLEIKAKDGNFIGIEPSPSHLVFLAGELLQAWSNDRIQACPHRVITPSKERCTMGLFSFNNGIIQVAQELVDDKHPLLYKNLLDAPEFTRFVAAEGWKLDSPIKAYAGVSLPTSK